uniref:Uncharacterized protein n=1 Tax=Aegilops tauschii subsp. strangulata TaxID=200361 RepID=A0A453NJG2_AEGTS
GQAKHRKMVGKNRKGKNERERGPNTKKDLPFLFQVSLPPSLLLFFSCTVHTV